MDEVGKYSDFNNMANLFVQYTKNKFSPDNNELIKKGVKKPF